MYGLLRLTHSTYENDSDVYAKPVHSKGAKSQKVHQTRFLFPHQVVNVSCLIEAPIETII